MIVHAYRCDWCQELQPMFGVSRERVPLNVPEGWLDSGADEHFCSAACLEFYLASAPPSVASAIREHLPALQTDGA